MCNASEAIKCLQTYNSTTGENDDLAQLTDKQLLEEARKLKPAYTLNSFLIGFVIGILLFGIFYSAKGLFMLIPVFLIKAFVNDPRNKRYKVVKEMLKARGLA